MPNALVGLEFLLLAALFIGLFLYRERQLERERDKWIKERQMLLERIQRPERPPMPDHKPIQRREPRDIAALRQIGTIQAAKGQPMKGPSDAA